MTRSIFIIDCLKIVSYYSRICEKPNEYYINNYKRKMKNKIN